MTTALALTPNLATASVLLQITGAPTPSATPYTQGTGVDGWVATNGTIAAGATYSGAAGFLLHANSGDGADFATATKTISGLTIGQKYRMTAYQKRGANSAEASIGVSGIGATTAITSTSTWVKLEYVFTATATSHVLQCFCRGNSGFDTQGDVNFDDIKLEAVNASFRPTTITRTDANGSRPVRLLNNQEPISGSMTVTDYEAAFTGTIRYDVVDAANVTTSASTNLNGVTVPYLRAAVLPQLGGALEIVKDYRSSRNSLGIVHRPIGRVSPLIVTGALATREGTLTIWCSTYTNALAVAAAATNGDVLLLRQPTFAGLDMYLIAQTVDVNPDDRGTNGRQWIVEIDYIEVDVPSDPLQGAVGWTYSALAGSYASYAAARVAFTDYADLVAGP